MELLRRSADGRLSELFGEVTLPNDIAQRRIGHRRMAHAALAGLAPGDRARLEAYAAGVNAYVAQATLPFEFRLLGATFPPVDGRGHARRDQLPGLVQRRPD